MSGTRGLRARFWAEAVLAGLTALLTLITLVSREWIEILFGVSPDGGDGSLEWALVVLLGLATVTFALLARAEWRRATVYAAR
ncbi:ABC transporter permease [Actinoplanes aureus]|uniref:ABC transporter permease n=1 Tax=Actinoplanes aureus TaxID=2792083 RepID=A0A931CGT1_9ACTN|nr:ABC transporter permease [Actinoplanes aureus]MBG0564640.1 ABC transporter permease [Actinoplanes aureus]